MCGCFGNSLVDECLEQQLNYYLMQDDDELFSCEGCDYCGYYEDWDYDDFTNELICPNCGFRINLNG